jgi:superfamily II DNA helicase RecQ
MPTGRRRFTTLGRPSASCAACSATSPKELAEKEGVPAYALFTNEQLADMVKQSITTMAALRNVKGVGPARAAKYGAAFLEVLAEHLGKVDEPSNGLFPESHAKK